MKNPINIDRDSFDGSIHAVWIRLGPVCLSLSLPSAGPLGHKGRRSAYPTGSVCLDVGKVTAHLGWSAPWDEAGRYCYGIGGIVFSITRIPFGVSVSTKRVHVGRDYSDGG